MVLAQTSTGNIRLTVRESADLDEDLILNENGSVLFVEDSPEDVGDATDYEIDGGGWVELRIGDDLVDLSMMKRVGLPIAVGDAVEDVKKHAAYVTKARGGYGAMREVAEMILKSQDKWDKILSKIS